MIHFPLAPCVTRPPLTYAVKPGLALGRSTLMARPERLERSAWIGLAARLADEPGLSNYQPTTLAERWREGRAAVAVADGEIVSYISLIPLFTRERSQHLFADLPLPRTPPAIELYESATGWTHPDWRGQGVSSFLRRHLLQGGNDLQRLYLSATIGLGASRVLPGLGWRLLSWAELPFVSSLIGMPCTGPDASPPLLPRQSRTLGPYLGRHLTPQQNPDHPWTDYCHLWLSDPELATTLERELATLNDGDLTCWRGRVATLCHLAPPEPGWKPFLFVQQYS